MELTNERFDRIMREYDRRRNAALADRDRRRTRIYAAHPEIARAEEEAVAAAAALVRSRIEDRSGAGEEAARTRLAALRAERDSLLNAAGIAPEDLEPVFTCPDCRDTGYIGEERCHCLKQAVLNELYAQSRLSPVLDEENFGTFRLDVYDDVKILPALGVTQRENMREVLETCRSYAQGFPEKKENLLLMGEVGTGKTFLAKSIARELLSRGCSVVYVSAHELFELLSPFRRGEDEERRAVADELVEADLLIVDDLGTEFANSMTASLLFYVINERLLRKLGTLITTNLSMNRLRDTYSERITSRLSSSYEQCLLLGEDVRRRA